MVAVMGLMGCSADEEAAPQAEGPMVELTSYVAGYEEAKRANEVTRAWTPPSGYSLYGDAEKSIGVFFTQNPAAAGGYEEESFYKSSGKWRVSLKDDELKAESYFLYGYVPRDNSITSTVSVLEDEGKTFADGAVLTLNNVPTVSNADFCVIIGAKNGTSDSNDGGLTRGQFEYAAKPTSGAGSGSNYVYLLFDHLFSALRVQMRVQGDYAALRTIKLKSLHLQAKAGDDATKKKTDISITLNKTTDGSSPIAKDNKGNEMITYTPTGTEESDGTIVESTDGIGLTTDYQTFQSHFMPQGITDLVLTSTYDVYDNDSEGHARNLIRQGCTATNKINIKKLFSGQTEALRGRRYTIMMTINPTYLLVLSEPDLDNPTVVVN
jgi:hypothetical protein